MLHSLALAALLAPIGWWAYRRATAPAEATRQGDPLPGWSVENAAEEVATLFAPEPTEAEADRRAGNVAAFLRVIRHAEGTADADGYRRIFGGRLFDSFADHPRVAVPFRDPATGSRSYSTAAGAYQFLAVSPLPGGGFTRMDTWDRLARRLELADFSPASQDRAAVQLIDEAGALADVEAGRFTDAVRKVRRVWASMPGAGYSQPERSIVELRAVYVDAGGAFA